ERLGIRLVRRGGTAAIARRILARRAILGLAADQDARGRGLFVPFFGRPASTHRGPAALALAFGAPLFIGALTRRGPGRRYRLEIELVDPGSAVGGRERRSEARVRDLTARWVGRLERMVRVSPEQYFWHHRRWKSRPPGTPEPVTGTTPEAEPRHPSEAREA
ncbi:MAG: lysophospholipid acyltransferase family protein, partial [Gemmatimonadota bacterium]